MLITFMHACVGVSGARDTIPCRADLYRLDSVSNFEVEIFLKHYIKQNLSENSKTIN